MACKGVSLLLFSHSFPHGLLFCIADGQKMELTIGVSVGSSIQIAAGMIPLLVLIAWPMGKNLTLFFVSSTGRAKKAKADGPRPISKPSLCSSR